MVDPLVAPVAFSAAAPSSIADLQVAPVVPAAVPAPAWVLVPVWAALPVRDPLDAAPCTPRVLPLVAPAVRVSVPAWARVPASVRVQVSASVPAWAHPALVLRLPVKLRVRHALAHVGAVVRATKRPKKAR